MFFKKTNFIFLTTFIPFLSLAASNEDKFDRIIWSQPASLISPDPVVVEGKVIYAAPIDKITVLSSY